MSVIAMLGDVEGPAKYHVGDEATFSAAADWLRAARGSVRIIAVSADPAFTASQHGVGAVREPLWPRRLAAPRGVRLAGRLLAALGGAGTNPSRWAPRDPAAFAGAVAGADLLYLCGGGNLRSGYPDALRLRSVAACAALAARRPLVAAGQTLGPDLGPQARALLRLWLPRVCWLGVRDPLHSPAWAEALGVPDERVHVQPDEAFDLAPAPVPAQLAERLAARPRPHVVASLHHQRGARLPAPALEARLLRALDALAEETPGLLLVPHLRGAGGGDLPRLHGLRARMRRPEHALVVDEPMSDRQVKALTAGADFVVATRYHAVVFALACGVPAFGIAQDDYTAVKLEGAFATAGLSSRVAPAESPELAERLMDALRARAEDAPGAARAADAARARLAELRGELAKHVDGLLGRHPWT